LWWSVSMVKENLSTQRKPITSWKSTAIFITYNHIKFTSLLLWIFGWLAKSHFFISALFSMKLFSWSRCKNLFCKIPVIFQFSNVLKKYTPLHRAAWFLLKTFKNKNLLYIDTLFSLDAGNLFCLYLQNTQN
jgi:hypothetical protein